MGQYGTLVRLFWRHLLRRKSLWVVIAIVGVVLLVNGVIQSQMKGMLENGVRYDIATRRAAAALDTYAEQIRQGAVMLVLVVAALIAPSARKDGTTQFVLTLSVSRLRLAAAQFGALALFVLLGTIVIQVGYSIAARRLGILRPAEAAFAWVFFFALLLVIAATSFALSLTRPALVVYAILLGVPYLLLPLLTTFANDWESTRVPAAVRLAAARTIENVGLLFPKLEALIVWPRLTWAAPARPPYPSWRLEALHELVAAALWVVIGLWAYRRYDFGSRTPMK
jgi:hypothetical protein